MSRFDQEDRQVINSMERFAELAAQGRDALYKRDISQLSELIDENFDTRRKIYNLPPWQIQMIETARRCGASENSPVLAEPLLVSIAMRPCFRI